MTHHPSLPSVLSLLFLLSCLLPGPLHAQAAPSLPAPDSPAALGWLIIVIAGAAAAINQVLGIVKHFRADPPNHTLYATKGDLSKLETDLDSRIAGLSDASAKSREKVYNLLNDLRDAIARLQTLTETQAQQISRLEGKLDAVSTRATEAQATAAAARHYSP